jgi:hypothetical protein
MPESRGRAPVGLIQRAARVAFAFLIMNVAAVAGLAAALTGRKVWR